MSKPTASSSLSLHDARHEVDRLRTLVEASKLINSSIEADTLFDSILTVARRELEVERGTLYFVDSVKREIWSKIASGLESTEIRLPFGHGLAGTVAASGEALILNDPYADPRFDRTQDGRSGFHTRSMLCTPIRNRSGEVVGVLQLLNKKSGGFGDEDLNFLEALSDHMAIAMENATLHIDLLEKQRMEQELQLGHEIQARLFAKPPENVSEIELAAKTISCFEVGGDYYDFLTLPGGDLGLAIGDVSGKGVAAAIIMSSVQAALRIAAPIETDLATLITRINALLYQMTGARKYVTFFFARYSPATGILRYVNAGHNPPYLIHDGEVVMLHSTGRPIGMFPTASYTEDSVQLQPGSTLVLYTDGFNEAANAEDEEFGNERWGELLAKHADKPGHELTETVLDAIVRFENGAAPTDDKTLVVLKRAKAVAGAV